MNRPVIAVLAFCLFVAGCGQDFDADISMTTIVWQGYPSEAPDQIGEIRQNYSLNDDFITTQDCLFPIGIYKTGQPFVVVVKDQFLCGGELKNGCFVAKKNTIYLEENTMFFFFSHEVIHWATGLGNEAHKTVYFTQCQGF